MCTLPAWCCLLNVILFHQQPVRAPVELLQQVHLVKVQVDMIAPVMKLMTVPTHMSVEVRYHRITYFSQCITVVRNTVVNATIKVNGKHPILGRGLPVPFDRSTWNLTWLITSAVWPHMLKIVKIGPAGPLRHRGEMSCSHVFLPFYIFADFLRSSGEHISGSIATVFVSNDVVLWGLISYGS